VANIINVIGNIFGTSGYSSHTRGLVNELNKITDCKIITNLVPGFERLVNDKELEMIKREQDYDINLIVTHPLHWRANLSAKRNFVYLIWEGDSIPKWIMEECLNEKIEKIIVPSHHTLLALTTSLKDHPKMKEVLYKTKLIPHGYNPKDFHSQRKKDGDTLSENHLEPRSNKEEDNTRECKSEVADNHADTFKFLANKGLRNLEDRGGIQYLIEAYLEEFTESENVELILKINPAYGIPNIEQMFPNLKKNGVPKVRFITDNYTTKQLNDLYNSCDVFVSPTRAEAFNIPVLESAACKKTSITTDFGGQTDFINNDNGYLIDYKLVPVTHEVEYESCMWAIPDHNHLKKLLRYTFEHPDEVKQKGEKVYEDCKHLTWANTAKQILNLIGG